jgi:Omp85 superfamily domain
VPEGGNWSIVTNLEYRSPRFLRGILQWVAFVDGGQVWNGSVVDVGGLLWTPGAGIRAFTPVGPIRVDIGYNPYLKVKGAAYFNAQEVVPTFVPLYCVSPGNTIPVHTTLVDGHAIPEQAPGFTCPATYLPVQSAGFFQRLAVSISIGQAF